MGPRFRFRRRNAASNNEGMTMVEHLRELRTRLVFSVIAFVSISVVVFFLYEPILEFFRAPLCEIDPEKLGPEGCDLIFTRPIDAFQFRLKMTAMVGIALSSPIWMYQLWAFIVPALTRREKRYALPFIACAVVFFLIGSAAAYLVMPVGIGFLIQIGGEGLVPYLGAEEYLNFVGFMLLGFGLLSELPLVIFFLGLAGAVTVEQLRAGRKIAIVSLAVMAAVVTPTQDPYTMLLLLGPLYGMYELVILLLSAVKKRRSARGA